MPTDVFRGYTVGSSTEDGDTIKEIICASKKFVIFLNQNDQMLSELDEAVCIDCNRSVVETQDLYAQLRGMWLFPSSIKRGTTILAFGLSNALESRKANDTTDFFKDAREYVTTKAAERIQAIYLLSAVASTLYLVFAIPYHHIPFIPAVGEPWSSAIGFGSLGAFLSVLQRFRSIPLRRYASPLFVGFDGAVRIALGAVLGLILILLSQGDLLLGLAARNTYAIAVFAIIAGFNERFVPDLLARTAVLPEERGDRP